MLTPLREKKPEQADEVTKGKTEKVGEAMKREKSLFEGMPLGRAERGLQDSKGVPLSKEDTEKRDAERENMRRETERLRQKLLKDAERLKGEGVEVTDGTSEKKGLRELVVGGITTLAEKLGKLRIVKDKTADIGLVEGVFVAAGAIVGMAAGYMLGSAYGNYLVSQSFLRSSSIPQVEAIFTVVGAVLGTIAAYFIATEGVLPNKVSG